MEMNASYFLVNLNYFLVNEYSSSAWDPYTKDQIAQLERVQRRAARWCLHDYSPLSSVSAMLDQLDWHTL